MNKISKYTELLFEDYTFFGSIMNMKFLINNVDAVYRFKNQVF